MPYNTDAAQVPDQYRFPIPSIGVFLGLQILDVLSTLIGLRLGAREGNSFIGHLLAGGPIAGLIISKILAAGLAAIAVFIHRKRMLVFLNIWFGGVVIWNVITIMLLAGGR